MGFLDRAGCSLRFWRHKADLHLSQRMFARHGSKALEATAEWWWTFLEDLKSWRSTFYLSSSSILFEQFEHSSCLEKCLHFAELKKSSLQAHSWLGRNGLTVQAGPSGGVPACEPHIERGPWRYGPMALWPRVYHGSLWCMISWCNLIMVHDQPMIHCEPMIHTGLKARNLDMTRAFMLWCSPYSHTARSRIEQTVDTACWPALVFCFRNRFSLFHCFLRPVSMDTKPSLSVRSHS